MLKAQNQEHVYDFFGGKSFDNETIFYRLQFEIKQGKVSGYAYIDEQGVKETKSLINGFYNAKTNTLSFAETQKIITKSKKVTKDYCFLHGNLKIELKSKMSKINGDFIEATISGKECSRGKIELISPDPFGKFSEAIKIEQENQKDQTELIVEDKPETIQPNLPTFSSEEKMTIKDDEEVTIFWNSDQFIIDIWDDAKEDDDEITVVFNDEKILNKYILKNKKRSLTFNLSEGENKIVFTANSTGLIANNTARVDLFDDSIKHQIITKLKLNKSVSVYLKRK